MRKSAILCSSLGFTGLLAWVAVVMSQNSSDSPQGLKENPVSAASVSSDAPAECHKTMDTAESLTMCMAFTDNLRLHYLDDDVQGKVLEIRALVKSNMSDAQRARLVSVEKSLDVCDDAKVTAVNERMSCYRRALQ